MGSLIVTEFVTLDGVAQAPGGPDGGFTHGGWQAPFLDPEAGEIVFEKARSMDALLLGRRTYEIFATSWPAAPLLGVHETEHRVFMKPSVGGGDESEARPPTPNRPTAAFGSAVCFTDQGDFVRQGATVKRRLG